jgi:hypothetical protein
MNVEQFLKRKPKKCPKCGHSPVASILYGMPAYDEELEGKLEDKSLVLGGCVVGYDDPKWQCANCDLEFYAWESIENPNFHR